MDQTFDITRFLKFAKWDLVYNRKEKLMTAIGLGAVLLLSIVAMTRSYYYISLQDVSKVAAVCRNAFEMYVIIFHFALCYFGSKAFHDLHSKGSRITFLMIPASMLEKYLWRMIYTFVVMPLVAICVPSLLFIICIYVFDHSGGVSYFIDYWTHYPSVRQLFGLIAVSMLFVVCGAYFSKHIFVKTLMVLVCFVIATCWTKYPSTETLAVFIVLELPLSYYLYSRRQVA